MKTDRGLPARAAVAAILALAAGLLVFACVTQVHVAQRVPLWGDELDTIRPSFRPWRGDHSFWWQIGQYNANPPGDNGVERLLYRSGALPWLRERSPELFWRLPYVFLYLATAAVALLGAWAWSGSLVAGFAALAATLSSPALFEYGTMVRFYMWLAFFVTSLGWLFLALAENRRSRLFYAFSLVATAGVCFHLMVAGIGYFFLAFALGCFTLDLLRSRGPLARRLARQLPRLVFGFLPYIMYRVALKHWVFIPPPTSTAPAWNLQAIVNVIAQCAPYGLSAVTVWTVAFLLGAALSWELASRRYARALQALFLLFLIMACPLVIYLAAIRSGASLMGRHLIFTVPALVMASVYLWKTGAEELKRRGMLNRRLGLMRPVGAVAIAALIFADTVPRLAWFASLREEGSSERVTYPFITWRQAYRALPGRGHLVIVGSQPDETNWMSDQGEYRAGIMKFYTEEFSPVFYSTKGGFTSEAVRDDRVVADVNAHPARFDFLVLDNLDRARKLFPALPWPRLECITYRPGARLSFCRVSIKG